MTMLQQHATLFLKIFNILVQTTYSALGALLPSFILVLINSITSCCEPFELCIQNSRLISTHILTASPPYGTPPSSTSRAGGFAGDFCRALNSVVRTETCECKISACLQHIPCAANQLEAEETE